MILAHLSLCFITGTGNGIADGCYSCSDAETATLAIVAGEHRISVVYLLFYGKQSIDTLIKYMDTERSYNFFNVHHLLLNTL